MGDIRQLLEVVADRERRARLAGRDVKLYWQDGARVSIERGDETVPVEVSEPFGAVVRFYDDDDGWPVMVIRRRASGGAIYHLPYQALQQLTDAELDLSQLEAPIDPGNPWPGEDGGCAHDGRPYLFGLFDR